MMLRNLPSEIRNIIYEKTLTGPEGKFFIGTEHSRELCRSRAVLDNNMHPFERLSNEANPRVASTRNIALLRTSKAIHAEAGAIIYGQKLVFSDLVALQSFLAGLHTSQISLLRHVVLDTDHWHYRTNRRPFMPGVFALLAGADSLESLDPDIRHLDPVSVRLNNAMMPDETTNVTVADWDATVACVMAAEVYCPLFTYLRRAVVVRGIGKVVEVLDVFDSVFREGPDCIRTTYQAWNIVGVPWTEERKAAMKKAMGEEIKRLLKGDNN